MEQVAPAAYNPHLQRVLKSFQTAAEGSLSGPSRYMSAWGDPSKMSGPELEEYRKALLSVLAGRAPPQPPAGPPKGLPQVGVRAPSVTDKTPESVSPYYGVSAFAGVQQMPLFLSMDSTRSEKAETILEGETIACFVVGGEKRLCLPQILKSVLRDFSLQQINTVCDELHIFCSRCNMEQLETMKMTGVLPPNAPSCGLITKTDAERLCNALLHAAPEKSKDPPTPSSFKVYHECFGKCKGIFSPEMYTSPTAKCVECSDCRGMFSPQKFVCHSHKALENRTCHWGFDSANWRSYLLLAKDQNHKDKLQRALDDMKSRFDYTNRYKRRAASPSDKGPNGEKKQRYDDGGVTCEGDEWRDMEARYRQMSAFRPWSPNSINLVKDGKLVGLRDGFSQALGQPLPSYLRTGPPVLLNPERVVPFTDKKPYDRYFAPNVSLAPPDKKSKSKSVDGDESESEDEDDLNEDMRLEACASTSASAVVSTLQTISSSWGHGALSHMGRMVKTENLAENNPELELSSDMEDSSIKSESVSSMPRGDGISIRYDSPTIDFSIEREQEVQLLQRALAGKVPNTTEATENFIDDFLRLRRRQEERVVSLVQVKTDLERELERVQVSSKERLWEAGQQHKCLRREMERMRLDHDSRVRDLGTTSDRLQREVDDHRAADGGGGKSRYKAQVDALQSALTHYETVHLSMTREITRLQEKVNQQDSNGHVPHSSSINSRSSITMATSPSNSSSIPPSSLAAADSGANPTPAPTVSAVAMTSGDSLTISQSKGSTPPCSTQSTSSSAAKAAVTTATTTITENGVGASSPQAESPHVSHGNSIKSPSSGVQQQPVVGSTNGQTDRAPATRLLRNEKLTELLTKPLNGNLLAKRCDARKKDEGLVVVSS